MRCLQLDRRLTVLALMGAFLAAQGDTMEACVHHMLHCSAVTVLDEFRSQDFG
jgi:hypothetical protein